MGILSVLRNERSWWVETADVLVGLAQIPDDSIDCVVTSPPFWNLRDYKVEGQIGLEKTLREFIAKIVEVFREIRRVLKPTGTVFLNLGDSYASYRDGKVVPDSLRGSDDTSMGIANNRNGELLKAEGFKHKDLMLVPHRVAIALQEDGWWVRQDHVWAKGVSFAETYHGSCMPESVSDRSSRSHEYVFLLTKSEKYYYDKYAVQEKIQTETYERAMRGVSDHHKNLTVPGQTTHSMHKARANGEGYNLSPSGGRNLRSVWCINPESAESSKKKPNSRKHYAKFPTKLVSVCVSLGSSERGVCSSCGKPWRRIVEPTAEYAEHLGKDWADYDLDQEEGRGHFEIDGEKSSQRPTKRNGASLTADYITKGWEPTCKCEGAEVHPAVVLDCFSGSGRCVKGARRLGRRAIGIELNPIFAEDSRTEILNDAPLFNA